MDITFLTPTISRCGGVKVIFRYAHGLSKRGHKVSIVCPYQNYAEKSILGLRVKYPKRVLMNFVRYKPSWTILDAIVKYVPNYEERYIPDGHVIVASAWQSATHVAAYSRSKGKKFYLFQHYEKLEPSYEGDKEYDNHTYLLKLRKITVSSHLHNVLETKYGQKSCLIPIGIDLDVFYCTKKSYTSSKKRICMLYYKAPWKRVQDGIEAFEVTRNRYQNIELVFYGPYDKPADFPYEYHCRPTNAQLREVFNSCDIFLCPSLKEGFGLPAAEAMACGCGVVTTDNGGCRDYAFHEKTALVSPPMEPLKLAENLMRLLGDQNLLRTIARNGCDYVQRFRWEDSIEKMENMFVENLRSDTPWVSCVD